MRNTMKAAFTSLLTVFSALPPAAPADSPDTAAYLQQMEQWRQARHERLSDPDGWMTLVGMEWLNEGENRVGSDESSDARVPGGPGAWGTVFLDGDELRFVTAPGAEVTVDGEAVAQAVLVADSQGKPTVVRSGDLSFHVIHRESYALRVKDRRAPNLLAFDHMPAYDIDPGWRKQGRLVPAEAGSTIEVANVLGQISQAPLFGTFEFDHDGEALNLLAIGTADSTSLWFIFADKTSGRETYGAGRFLYSDGMPDNGRLVVDFNKAYNPPCAYNDYSTCTLPPPQNRLRTAVRAGEKKYHE